MKNMADVVHEDHIPTTSPDFAFLRPYLKDFRSVFSVHFYDSCVIIEKQFREKNTVTYHNRHLSH